MSAFRSAHDPGAGRGAAPRLPFAPALVLVLFGSGAMGPAPLAGQLGFVLAGHVGSSAVAPAGVMVDLAAELRQGVWGLRAGASMDAAGTALAPMLSPAATSSGAWAADVDVGLNLGRVPYVGRVFGRSDPTLFIGAGMAGMAEGGAPGTRRGGSAVPVWSWGARAGLPLLSWLGLEVEARRRDTFGVVSPDVYPAGPGWEYRAGLAVRFGGSTGARSTVAPPRGAPAGERGRGTREEPRDRWPTASAEEVAERAIRTGERYLGTPYRWGGDSPAEGFDCSGFVRYVFAAQGVDLPRVSRDQARAGRALPARLEDLARGDLLFFASDGVRIHHVAIWAGEGRILHASSSGRGVRYDDLSSARGRWYADHLVAVRRVIGSHPVARPPMTASEDHLPRTRRTLPLNEAFEALEAERDDGAPPPDR